MEKAEGGASAKIAKRCGHKIITSNFHSYLNSSTNLSQYDHDKVTGYIVYAENMSNSLRAQTGARNQSEAIVVDCPALSYAIR